MNVPVCTKIAPEEKQVLQFLAYSQGTTPSNLIRQAILAQYQLDSVDLRTQALSFFEEGARRVAQSAAQGETMHR